VVRDGLDVSYVALDKLADLLANVLEEVVLDIPERDIGDVDNDPVSLTSPILRVALAQIDCRAVAEALLRDAGKWAPDPTRPTAI
jgi:hypothetical protein